MGCHTQVGRLTGFCVLLVTLQAAAVADEPEVSPELQARIERLIEELDDDRFAVRQRAEKELTEIGEPARERLAAAAKDASPERSQRALQILARLPRPDPPERAGDNLTMQMLAMHNFHDVFGSFPSAYSATKSGTPLLSWRVALLPFLEEKELYDQFRHEEPWDSEHNAKLIPRMPRAFAAPGSKAEPGRTVYLGVGGRDGIFVPPTRRVIADGEFSAGINISRITDGTSNTIGIVEASDELAVVWTKPEEWVPDEKAPIKGLVGLRADGFYAALCDGRVQIIPQTINAKTLRLLFNRHDGMPVEVPQAVPSPAPGR